MKVLQNLTDEKNDFRIPRLNILLEDLKQSLEFATYILEKGLHKNREPSQIVLRAFETSMVISYARSFTSVYDFEGKRREPLLLKGDIETVLTDDEKKLHFRVMDKRNRDCAHSDDRAHLDKSWMYSTTFIEKRLTLMPLAESDTVMLVRIIKNWIAYLKKEKALLVQEKRANLRPLSPTIHKH